MDRFCYDAVRAVRGDDIRDFCRKKFDIDADDKDMWPVVCLLASIGFELKDGKKASYDPGKVKGYDILDSVRMLLAFFGYLEREGLMGAFRK